MSIRRFQGDPLGPGTGVGILTLLRRGVRPPPAADADPEAELQRFRRAADALRSEILQRAERLEAEVPADATAILRVHAAMLGDPDLDREVAELIRCRRLAAADAVERVLEGMGALLGAAEDPLLAQRAADLRDLAHQLADRLPGAGAGAGVGAGERILQSAPEGAVLALPELMPSLVLDAQDRGVAGFIVEAGTTVSHGAILAKSFGIPVVRLGALATVEPFAGCRVLVSGAGEVLVEPSEDELARRRPPAQDALPEVAGRRSATRLSVSIVDPAQLGQIDWAGVDGVGLYRSESLFLRYREGFPGEDEQYRVYRRLFAASGERPVVFRTADLGADKPVEHMRLGPQTNPSLGLRAHRLFRFHPEILVVQIRAVLRAARGRHRLRLLYPMIESLEQLRMVRALVEQAVRSLDEGGSRFSAASSRGC